MRARAAAFVTIVAAMLAAPQARADDKAACVAASDQGQSLRDQGKLKSAREQFLVCARDICPIAVRRDCSGWLAGVEASLPTIVLAAVDANQRDLFRVHVSVDGAPLVDSLDGKAIAIDPGPHTLRFETEGLAPVELPVLVREGEQRRIVSARFSAASSTPSSTDSATPTAGGGPEAPRSSSAPIAAIVVGALGVVAFGSFAILGVTGKSDLATLHDTCGLTHSCAQVDVDATKRKLLGADISLGLGIAAVATVTALVVVHVRATRAPAAGASAPPRVLRAGVAPVSGGAAMVIAGRF